MSTQQDYDDFIAWQCRLRKYSMRELDGRPTAGMSAGIHSVNGGDEQARLSFLILHRDTDARTREFAHIVRKTQDPTQWIKNGLRILAERHYQEAEPFDRRLTALFSTDSSVAYALLKAGACHLKFSEKSIEHAFDFDIESLDREDPLFEATYWHNHLFNPTLPGQVRVLAFSPRL